MLRLYLLSMLYVYPIIHVLGSLSPFFVTVVYYLYHYMPCTIVLPVHLIID
jgi:hypothetical protein